MADTKSYFYDNEPITWLGEPAMIGALADERQENRMMEFSL
jgi:hypothetical protein